MSAAGWQGHANSGVDSHLFGRTLKSSQIGATFITIFFNIRRVLGNYYFINLCVSLIYEAGQKDSQVHTYNENLQSTFLKMLKCNFAMFSIWQASTWQTGVGGASVPRVTRHIPVTAVTARYHHIEMHF